MLLKKNIVLIGMVLVLQFKSQAQSSTRLYDDFSEKYFTQLYGFQFNNVRSLIDSIDTKHQLEKHLYKANYYFWRKISGDSTNNYFSLCKQELNQQITLLKTAKLSNEEYVFYNSLTYSYLMRLELMNNNYLNAVKILDKSIKHFEKALDNKDNSESFLFLSGMYNYFVAYASKEYTLLNVYLKLYKPGDKDLGLKQLIKCTKSENLVIKTESLYFLLKIYLNTEKDYVSAKYYGEELLKLHPNNIIFHREYYLVLLKLNLKNDVKVQKDKIFSVLDKNHQLTAYQKKYFTSLIK